VSVGANFASKLLLSRTQTVSLELIKEINRLLEEKEERLKSARKPNDQIQ
jgi:hypothetical protein